MLRAADSMADKLLLLTMFDVTPPGDQTGEPCATLGDGDRGQPRRRDRADGGGRQPGRGPDARLPSWFGKIATAIYIVTGVVTLYENYRGVPSTLVTTFVDLSLAVTLVSSVHYVGRVLAGLSSGEQPSDATALR